MVTVQSVPQEVGLGEQQDCDLIGTELVLESTWLSLSDLDCFHHFYSLFHLGVLSPQLLVKVSGMSGWLSSGHLYLTLSSPLNSGGPNSSSPLPHLLFLSCSLISIYGMNFRFIYNFPPTLSEFITLTPRYFNPVVHI